MKHITVIIKNCSRAYSLIVLKISIFLKKTSLFIYQIKTEVTECKFIFTVIVSTQLRTTVPLVSYIRNSLRFWYYAFLSACCQNVEKKLASLGKFGRERGLNF